nr:MAG TPA: hypothetical protein [Caudoviricetes sp.]
MVAVSLYLYSSIIRPLYSHRFRRFYRLSI